MRFCGKLSLTLGLLIGQAVAAITPRPSPEFVINMNGAPPLLLSQFRGKVVALAFMFTT